MITKSGSRKLTQKTISMSSLDANANNSITKAAVELAFVQSLVSKLCCLSPIEPIEVETVLM